MSLTYCTGTQEEHGKLVHEFLLEHFRVTEPITTSLGATRDDVVDFFADLRDGGLSHNKYSTLVFNGDQLAAICLNSIKELKEETHEVQPIDPYKDYAKAISSGPYSQRTANRLVVFVETMEEDMAHLMVTPCSILKIDVLCVRSDYQGRGIARTLVEKAFATAREAGCQWVGAAATAVASQSLFIKMGFRTIKELPFCCFREDGIPVYRVLPDGGRSGKLMIYKLDQEDNDDLK